jgi:hypothetical protein
LSMRKYKRDGEHDNTWYDHVYKCHVINYYCLKLIDVNEKTSAWGKQIS